MQRKLGRPAGLISYPHSKIPRTLLQTSVEPRTIKRLKSYSRLTGEAVGRLVDRAVKNYIPA